MAKHPRRLRLGQPATYRIKVQGVLDKSWTDYLDNLTITQVQGADREPITILTGEVVDQLMLIGTLHRLCNLGLPIFSVEWLMEGVPSS